MKIHIGCSGYSYDDWRGEFYPDDLPKDQWLSFYADHFSTVEINHSFYKFPEKDQFKKWMDETPGHFRFTIKGHRYFTHMKKFNTDKDFGKKLDDFQETLPPLKEKLGCVLWQLPGNLHKDTSKLDSFCKMLNTGHQHVFEFRHESWFDDEVYDLLGGHNAGFCILSAPDNLPEDMVLTGKTAYIRFHGKKEWYDYLYSDKELKTWKKRIDDIDGADRLYVYFNNDQHAHSVKNARRLMELLDV